MRPIIHVRENWYRDVWLFIISVALLVTFLVSFHRIYEARVESAVRACQEQNSRNMETIRTFDNIINELPQGSRRRTRARQSRATMVLMIDALAPIEDCKTRAHRLIK